MAIASVSAKRGATSSEEPMEGAAPAADEGGDAAASDEGGEE
jgi:hypothetical protein